LVRVGEQDEVTARQDQVGRDAGALGADGAFGHLGDDFAARRVEAGDVFLGNFGFVAPAGAAVHDLDAAVKVARDNIPVVQKRVLLEPDVHKGRFEAVFQIADLAFEDAADQPLFGGAFDGELFEAAFFGDGDAGFEGFRVDDDFLVDALDGLDQPLNLFDEVVGRGAEGFHNAPGRLLDGHRGEGFLLFAARRGRRG